MNKLLKEKNIFIIIFASIITILDYKQTISILDSIGTFSISILGGIIGMYFIAPWIEKTFIKNNKEEY